MRFAETYERLRGVRPVFSFEVFPPRTERAAETFRRIVPGLVELEPSFITVTYGAFGSTREKTIEIAREIRSQHGVETACHLTCVGSTSRDVDAILDQIAAAGIENIVALRGDPPAGETEFKQVEGGYRHAIELVRHIRRRGSFGIAVAGYPETHVEAPDAATDLAHLSEKVGAGADVVVTQLFYDNRHYFDFVDRARAAGISCPIVPGILPILSARQVRRITKMCGASIPAELHRELDAAGEDDAAAREIGIRQAVGQVRELLARGAPGVHFYVLNRASHIRQILEQI